ncbi:MAG TPA: metal-dependent hydrolase [Flavisolibacter sp.]
MTHIALGACIGEAWLGKQLGKRALFLGAVAQSVPDIDFVSVLWNDPAENLLAHRGFTHSFLFGLLASFFLALAAARWQRAHRIRLSRWMLFFGAEIMVHLLLDYFNSYAMGLLEPFSHERFAGDALFVVDPFFSLAPLIAFLVLWRLPVWHRRRRGWWKVAVVLPGAYLLYCGLNKMEVTRETRRALQEQQVSHKRFFTTPTPLNNWLWYVVAENDSGFFVGFHSILADKKNIDFTFFPRNDHLIEPLRKFEEMQDLLRFSQGYYTAEMWSDTLVFNDLRFGQIIGWHDPREKFVFHYFVGRGADANKLVVQRGRFARWTWPTTRSMLRRIRGD